MSKAKPTALKEQRQAFEQFDQLIIQAITLLADAGVDAETVGEELKNKGRMLCKDNFQESLKVINIDELDRL